MSLTDGLPERTAITSAATPYRRRGGRQARSGECYGFWTVIGPKVLTVRQGTYWTCRCICGVERLVRGKSLTSGASKSCGCRRKDVLSEAVGAVVWKGETLTVPKACRKAGINYASVYARARAKCFSLQEAFDHFCLRKTLK